MPAQAVPWPTRSRASGSSTTWAVLTVDVDAEMTGHAPGDVGMVAVDAGVDDRDRHPRPIRIAEDLRAIEAAERRIDSPQRVTAVGREGLAPRRQRPGARRRPFAPVAEQRVQPFDRELDRVGVDVPEPRDAIGERPRRVVVAYEPGGGARHERLDRRPHRVAAPSGSATNPESTSASTTVASARTRPRRTALAAKPAIEVATSRSRIENVPPCAIERLEHADGAGLVGDGHGQQRRRHVAGRLRHRPLEPGIGGDVGDGQRLARREHVAGDAARRLDRHAHDVTCRRPGGRGEHQPVGPRLVQRDRRRLRVERDDGETGDRDEQVVVPGVTGRRRRADRGESAQHAHVARRSSACGERQAARVRDDELVAVEPHEPRGVSCMRPILRAAHGPRGFRCVRHHRRASPG